MIFHFGFLIKVKGGFMFELKVMCNGKDITLKFFGWIILFILLFMWLNF